MLVMVVCFISFILIHLSTLLLRLFLVLLVLLLLFFFSSRRRHTRCLSDWSSDVCSSDLHRELGAMELLPDRPKRAQAIHDDVTRACSPREQRQLALVVPAPWLRPVEQEIGRASCRESVEICVVAVA